MEQHTLDIFVIISGHHSCYPRSVIGTPALQTRKEIMSCTPHPKFNSNIVRCDDIASLLNTRLRAAPI